MWLWILAVLAAYFIKGLCGFANTLVLTTILSFGTDNTDISPVDLLLCYPMNGIMTWKNRKKLDRRVCLTLSALVLAGSMPMLELVRAASRSAAAADAPAELRLAAKQVTLTDAAGGAAVEVLYRMVRDAEKLA